MTARDGSAPAVLMVFPWCMDRLGHGNIRRVLAMASFLSGQGFDVDLVYQGNPGVASQEASFHGFRRTLRVDGWRSVEDQAVVRQFEAFYEGYVPVPTNMWPGTALTMLVRALVDGMDYAAVVSSYAWTAPIFDPLPRRVLRIVDLHDVIAVHGRRASEATGRPSPYSMEARTEHYLWRAWDVLLAITPEEARLVAAQARPSQAVLCVPHAVSPVEAAAGAPGTVVYAGSDNPSNRDAVGWLLDRVWPQVVARVPHARLRLVGLIAEAMAQRAAGLPPGVDLVGMVDDPVREMAAAAVVVAPYLYGSGLKIKIVEAAAAARPVVTTKVGAEGTDLRHGFELAIADTPEGFAGEVIRLLDSPDARHALGQAARRQAALRFSEAACYGALADVIRNAARNRVEPGAIPSAVEQRLIAAWEAAARPPATIWGNGSHTRELLRRLERHGVPVRRIVDKGASTGTSSEEGLPVVPAAAFVAAADEFIVLSSQVFEAEMWQDLAAYREGGGHALALYRHELITPLLRARLGGSRVKPHAQRAQPGRRPARRLLVAEPSAGRSRGPFLRLARLLDAAARDLEVVVAGARRRLLDGLEPEELALFVPAFEFAHWDLLPEAADDPWRAVARFAAFLADDLATLGSSHGLGARDVVLFHTANLVELLGAAAWLDGLSPDERPAVRFLFHFLPWQEARWLRVSEDEVIHACQLTLARIEQSTGDGLRLLAQCESLAPALEMTFNRQVWPMGFPAEAGARPDPWDPRRAPRVLYAGEARSDKGFALLPRIAERLAPRLSAGEMTLVCHAARNEFADDSVRRAIEALGRQPGVELIERFLPSREYDALVTGSDLVLLPYEPGQYRHRLSAVFVDATVAGRPVIVPDGTWMSAQIDAGRGAGERFASLAPAEIAAAVARALDRIDVLGEAAAAAAPAVARAHDPARALAVILGVAERSA